MEMQLPVQHRCRGNFPSHGTAGGGPGGRFGSRVLRKWVSGGCLSVGLAPSIAPGASTGGMHTADLPHYDPGIRGHSAWANRHSPAQPDSGDANVRSDGVDMISALTVVGWQNHVCQIAEISLKYGRGRKGGDCSSFSDHHRFT